MINRNKNTSIPKSLLLLINQKAKNPKSFHVCIYCLHDQQYNKKTKTLHQINHKIALMIQKKSKHLSLDPQTAHVIRKAFSSTNGPFLPRSLSLTHIHKVHFHLAVALRNTHTCSTPSLRRLPKSILKTVPVLVWLTKNISQPEGGTVRHSLLHSSEVQRPWL